MANEDVVRLLVDLVRDQAKVLSAIAEGVAVGSDRSARMAEAAEKMQDILTRLDVYVEREERANADARAREESARTEERAAFTRLMDTLRAGLSSALGQRVIQTVVLAFLAWAGVHYGFVTSPSPAIPAPVVEPTPSGQEAHDDIGPSKE